MNLFKWWQRYQLQEERFAFLFDTALPDEFVSIDCETTGLNPKKDEILSIGAVKIKKNVVKTSESIHLFVEPKGEISAESIKVHHLRQCDLTGAMPLEDAIERVLHFIGSRALVGYYLEFDVAMLNRAIKPYIGTTLPNKQIEISALYHDYKIELIPQAFIDLRFDTILQDLDLPVLGKHSALNDATMAALMFAKLNQHKKGEKK